MPVTLPPGRAALATRPSPTASARAPTTMGIVVVTLDRIGLSSLPTRPQVLACGRSRHSQIDTPCRNPDLRCTRALAYLPKMAGGFWPPARIRRQSCGHEGLPQSPQIELEADRFAGGSFKRLELMHSRPHFAAVLAATCNATTA